MPVLVVNVNFHELKTCEATKCTLRMGLLDGAIRVSIAEDIDHNIHNMTIRVKQVEQEFIKNGSESVALAALVVSGHKAIDSKLFNNRRVQH